MSSNYESRKNDVLHKFDINNKDSKDKDFSPIEVANSFRYKTNYHSKSKLIPGELYTKLNINN